VRIATQLVGDVEADIRAEAARVLASVAGGGKVGAEVARALVKFAGDSDRDVRLLAVRALARLGPGAPEEAGPALLRAFDRADEAERLVLLEAARAIGAGELVPMAISDGSPQVRIAAVETAIASRTAVASTINAALTDADPVVRRAALARLADEGSGLDQEAKDRALALALGDADPAITELALATLARTGEREQAVARLGQSLTTRSERERGQAAAGAVGLVERDPVEAARLLEPLLDDPSHDVRVAMLPSLGAAYAATNSPEQLAQMLRGAERHAMRRLAATAAFVVLARTEAGQQAADSALAAVADKGPPLARMHARLARGLIAADAEGLEFLQLLVP
jgi:HEAT repeat protein